MTTIGNSGNLSVPWGHHASARASTATGPEPVLFKQDLRGSILRVLITWHSGYIGAVMVPFFQAAAHEVVGLDTGLFDGCDFGPAPAPVESMQVDIRDVRAHHVEGFDAVVHLAALSNDPLGNLNPQTTYDINHVAAVTVARAAKQ